MDYIILPCQSWWSDDGELRDGDSYEGGERDHNYIFGPLEPDVGTMKTAHGEWKSKKYGSKVMDATVLRIHDGSLMEWIQQEAPSVVGATQVGHEEFARCVALDENATVPIPFADPLDTASWDSLQMFGSILFIFTFLGTSMFCLVGHIRSKQVEEWTAIIGDESVVYDFLNLSRQFLPPECLYQRDEGAATLVTMPTNE